MANGRTRNGSNVARLSLLLTVALAAPAWSQVQSGRIVGTVRDAQQATVPKATVTVTSSATGQSLNVTTNDSGDYVVTPVNPGLYRVTVALAGFQTAVVNAVEVPVAQSVRVDVELKIGGVAETTEVTATAPLLDTESGTLGQSVTNTQIVNLPLNGRSFYELARLTPGAAGLPGGASVVPIRANFINGTAISGVRGSQLTFQIDGVDVTDHHQGGTYIQTSVDALQEFKVQQSAYSAEFSQAGGMLNVATKSGASEFHGGLFEFLRNDVFDAADYFVRQKQELNRHQFGGTLGGPLVKGKTFFFVSYEGTRESRQLPVNLTVASAAMKQGDFSGISNRIYDPLTGQPFPGNVIPAEPAVAPGAVLRPAHPRSQHEHGDPRLVRGPHAGRRPVHAPDRPQSLREAQDLRPLQLPRQPDGRSQLEPGRPVPCRTRTSAALTSIPAARTWSRPSRARSARPC